jgi:hypothetical protein
LAFVVVVSGKIWTTISSLFLNKMSKTTYNALENWITWIWGHLGSEKKFFYRNKMEFSFSNSRWLTEKKLKVPKILETEMH